MGRHLLSQSTAYRSVFTPVPIGRNGEPCRALPHRPLIIKALGSPGTVPSSLELENERGTFKNLHSDFFGVSATTRSAILIVGTDPVEISHSSEKLLRK